MTIPNPRAVFSERIGQLPSPSAQAFARFLREPDENGVYPCWGAVYEEFERQFPGDDERITLWSVLRDVGDSRALLLFVDASRVRPVVMDTVGDDIGALSRVIQRALVTLEEVAAVIERVVDQLDPSARQLWRASEDERSRERNQAETLVRDLRSVSYFTPANDIDDREPPGRSTGSVPST